MIFRENRPKSFASLCVGALSIAMSACANQSHITDSTKYSIATEGNKTVIKLGCTTDPTDFLGVGKDCSAPQEGPVCRTTKSTFKQSSLTVKKIPDQTRGYNPRCFVMPADYVSYFGRGDVSEPTELCFRAFVSSPSGVPNATQTGQVLCEFSFETHGTINEPGVQ